MIWSLIAVMRSLQRHGYLTLAKRYEQYLDILKKNVLTIFWAGDGTLTVDP